MSAELPVIAIGFAGATAALAISLAILGLLFRGLAGPLWWAAGGAILVLVAFCWRWGEPGGWLAFLRNPLFVASLLVQGVGFMRFAGGRGRREITTIACLVLVLVGNQILLPLGADVRSVITNASLGGAAGLAASLAWGVGVERGQLAARLAGVLAGAAACAFAMRVVVALVGAPLAQAIYDKTVTWIFIVGIEIVFVLWLVCLVALAAGAAAEAARRALARERAEGNHDRLTGALNWRGFYEAADSAFVEAVARDQSMALIVLDIDHFHAIVIADGRDTADRLLVALMNVIGAELRGNDLVARLGVDELALLLVATSDIVAVAMAERLSQGVAELDWPALGLAHPATISMGIAERRMEDPTFHAIERRARSALVAAKQGGRARIETA